MEVRLLDIEETPRSDIAHSTARLSRRCNHVAVDGRLIPLGYRFYPMPGSEVPSFFCKRFIAGSRSAAITLLAGYDPQTGEAVLEDCRSARDAARHIAAGRAGWWVVRLTYGARMLHLDELTGSYARRDPAGYVAFVAELEALGLARRSTCPICRPEDR
jgi:hypothetical protein